MTLLGNWMKMSFVESSTKTGWYLLKVLQKRMTFVESCTKAFQKCVNRYNTKFCKKMLGVLSFVEDPRLSVTIGRATSATLISTCIQLYTANNATTLVLPVAKVLPGFLEGTQEQWSFEIMKCWKFEDFGIVRSKLRRWIEHNAWFKMRGLHVKMGVCQGEGIE